MARSTGQGKGIRLANGKKQGGQDRIADMGQVTDRSRRAVRRELSPCIQVCELNDQQICIGCRRSIDEIVRWASLSTEDRKRILADLPARRV